MQMTKAQQDRLDNLHERILEEYLEKAKKNLAFAKDRKQKAIKNNIPNHLLIKSINTVLHWERVIEKTEDLLARARWESRREA